MAKPVDVLTAQRPQPATPKRVLHIGCGPKQPGKLHAMFKGWKEIRLDIDVNVQPDVVASITDMSAVTTGSMDAVYSSHNLEHLMAHEVPEALAEIHRALTPVGFLLVTVPDLQTVAELVASDKLEETAYESPAGPIAALDTLFGLRTALAEGNLYMAHRTGFTARSLGNVLCRAGFAEVTVQRSDWDLWAMARKAPATSFKLINAKGKPLAPW